MLYICCAVQFYKGRTDISNGFIADCLHINVIDVVNAFLFCASEGLVAIQNFTSVGDGEFDVEFCFDVPCGAKQSDFKPHYKSGEIGKRMEETKRWRKPTKLSAAFWAKPFRLLTLNCYIPCTTITASHRRLLWLWWNILRRGQNHHAQAGSARGSKWSENGIDSVAKANLFIKKREQLLSFAGTVRRIIGANERKLTTKELEYIDRWQELTVRGGGH